MRAATSVAGTVFHVGVAFIGKRAPASYEKEPWKRYDISTTTFQPSTDPEVMLRSFTSEDQRDYTSHNIAVDMQLEILDVNGEVVETEHTVTENISPRGATLFTTLEVPSGRFIRLTSAQRNVTAYAAVRNRNTGVDGVPRIHVEFIDKEWPL